MKVFGIKYVRHQILWIAVGVMTLSQSGCLGINPFKPGTTFGDPEPSLGTDIWFNTTDSRETIVSYYTNSLNALRWQVKTEVWAQDPAITYVFGTFKKRRMHVVVNAKDESVRKVSLRDHDHKSVWRVVDRDAYASGQATYRCIVVPRP